MIKSDIDLKLKSVSTGRNQDLSKTHRQESDAVGTIWVDRNNLWGAQTERAKFYFQIGTEMIPAEIIRAMGLIKAAAAKTNGKLNTLNKTMAKAIYDVGMEIFNGKWLEQFQLPIWQSGSGTSTNMNVNEVISNIASERLGGSMGINRIVNANDHVNLHQSTNDTVTTALHIALVTLVKQKLIPVLNDVIKDLQKKVNQWKNIVKVGRTHLQDAVPMTFGQEFSAFMYNIQECRDLVIKNLDMVRQLPQGGTAIGTCVGSVNKFDIMVVQEINEITDEKFKVVANKFAYISAHQSFLNISSCLNTLATTLMKLTQDLQILGSGPRCGIGELALPNNEPGSSIMPGKSNPTQTEALQMICVQTISHHFAITVACARGILQLNTYRPLMAHNLIVSIHNLSDGMASFLKHCLADTVVNEKQSQTLIDRSLLSITAITSKIGYNRAAQIVKRSLENGTTLKQELEKEKDISPADIKFVTDYHRLV